MENTNWKSNSSLWSARSQVLIILAALIVTAIGSFAIGYVAATANATGNVSAMKVFWEAWKLTDSEFYYDKPSQTDRVYGAINGMLATYNDQFTVFVPPTTAAVTAQIMQGESGGIGARVGLDKDGQLVVTEAMVGKAAALAGVQNGDIILAVNDKSIKGMKLNDAVDLIHGPIGTQVKLTLKRPNVAEPVIVNVKREQINVYAKMLPGSIGYISLSLFSRTAPTELDTEFRRLQQDNPKALIFDLRGNPGGYLDEALKIGDYFLPEGPIASEKLSSGEKTQFTAKTGDVGESIPMVVLVDKGSASAAEIVAGALHDRHRAVLIGQQTFGKGSVQTLYTLSDGSQLRVTHGAWYTPNETPIQRQGQHIGLSPDIPVQVPDNPALGADPILDAAVTYVKIHYMNLPIL